MAQILVIENEQFVLENVDEILSLHGFTVIGAKDGVEGVEFAQQYKPEVILCDIVMPKMDGYEVLKKIRSTAEIASTPFLFFSAIGDQKSVENSHEMGADGYIRKPFTIEELITTINIALDQRG